MNYFTLFGLSIFYSIDIQLLTSRFYNLQRQFHPDRFVHQTQEERLISLQRSSDINQAYQTLKHPIKRAEYILFLHGFNLSHISNTACDTLFLAKQLTLREKFDAIQQKKDSKNLIIKFYNQLNDTIQKYTETMVNKLNRKQWKEASSIIYKLYFLNNLKKQVEVLLENPLKLD